MSENWETTCEKIGCDGWDMFTERKKYVGQRARINVLGQRKRGIPKRRWEDCVKDDKEAVGARKEDEKTDCSRMEGSTPATPEMGIKPGGQNKLFS